MKTTRLLKEIKDINKWKDILPQETRKISNKQSNLTPEGSRERRTNKT